MDLKKCIKCNEEINETYLVDNLCYECVKKKKKKVFTTASTTHAEPLPLKTVIYIFILVLVFIIVSSFTRLLVSNG